MITVDDLVYRTAGTTILDGVSLRIEDGEFVTITGPNGAGKTTLIKHFNALLEPSSGRISVNGYSATDHPVKARTSVGMVFQHPRDGFVASTVGADIAFGPRNLGLSREAIERRVNTALDTVGMAGRTDDRIDQLSGGEQTRVAIAGALAMNPDHLVLDEPFAGLDSSGQRVILDKLESIVSEGHSVVVVTHNLKPVSDHCDRIGVLVDGQLEAAGPPATVKQHVAEFHH